MIRHWKFEARDACAYWLVMSTKYQNLSWVTKCQWHSVPNKDVAMNLYLYYKNCSINTIIIIQNFIEYKIINFDILSYSQQLFRSL